MHPLHCTSSQSWRLLKRSVFGGKHGMLLIWQVAEGKKNYLELSLLVKVGAKIQSLNPVSLGKGKSCRN